MAPLPWRRAEQDRSAGELREPLPQPSTDFWPLLDHDRVHCGVSPGAVRPWLFTTHYSFKCGTQSEYCLPRALVEYIRLDFDPTESGIECDVEEQQFGFRVDGGSPHPWVVGGPANVGRLAVFVEVAKCGGSNDLTSVWSADNDHRVAVVFRMRVQCEPAFKFVEAARECRQPTTESELEHGAVRDRRIQPGEVSRAKRLELNMLAEKGCGLRTNSIHHSILHHW